MVLSQLIRTDDLLKIGARQGGVPVLEATILTELLTNETIKKELSGALARSVKSIAK